MTPEAHVNRILVGDALARLRELPDACVQTCVTSPPYHGLRSYNVDGQIGLEGSLDEYISKLVEVFREVRRVLRDDGLLWLNLGDAYTSGGRRTRDPGPRGQHRPYDGANPDDRLRPDTPSGLKPKDLIGIPWRVAFALQADGFYLRSDVVWNKQNCLPESVEDRPTRSHEYVFMLSKSERYFYDCFAIKEPHTMRPQARPNGHKRRRPGVLLPEHTWSGTARDGAGPDGHPAGRNKRDVWTIPTSPNLWEMCASCKRVYVGTESPLMRPDGTHLCVCGSAEWVQHFASFPEALVAPCILAGTSEGGACARCAAPRRRILKAPEGRPMRGTSKGDTGNHDRIKKIAGQQWQDWKDENPTVSAGFEATCGCGAGETSPCVVLDCFSGSGTTALVALKSGRSFVGIELNPDYARLSEARIAQELAQKRMF